MDPERSLGVTVLEGEGSAAQLEKLLDGRRIAVVHGRSYERNPIRSVLERAIKPASVLDCGAWGESPTSDDVAALCGVLRTSVVGTVLAVGGGSVLDVAKAARSRCCPETVLAAIPTTAGSGSEATPYSSILTREGDHWTKVSETRAGNIPGITILDPLAVQTLPPSQRAISSIDALSQALESYWCVRATPESRAMSLRCIQLLACYMDAYLDGSNDNLQEMLRAAHLSGRAIALAPTNLCHAISYPLTARFGIPHGWAVGFTLSRAVIWHERVLVDLGGALCEAAGVASLGQLADWIEHLREKSGLSCQLSGWGLTDHDLPGVVFGSYRPDRMDLSPRSMAPATLHGMLREIL